MSGLGDHLLVGVDVRAVTSPENDCMVNRSFCGPPVAFMVFERQNQPYELSIRLTTLTTYQSLLEELLNIAFLGAELNAPAIPLGGARLSLKSHAYALRINVLRSASTVHYR